MKHSKEKINSVKGKIKIICEKSCKQDGFLALKFEQNSAQIIGMDIEDTNTAIAFTMIKNGSELITTGHFYRTPISYEGGKKREIQQKAFLGIDSRSLDNIEIFYVDASNLLELTAGTSFTNDNMILIYWENEDYSQLFIGSYDIARNDVVRRMMTSRKKDSREFLRQVAVELLFSYLPGIKKELTETDDFEDDEIETDGIENDEEEF